MKSIDDIKELDKLLRSVLITQSELSASMVRNSLSLYGTDLDKVLEESIFDSIEQSDVIMLFELVSNDNDNCVSMSADDELGLIEYDRAFKLNIIMYGLNSSNVASKLVARVRSEEVRTELYDKGVYIESISDPNTINEYKNEMMWLRNDVTIKLACKLDITLLSVDHEFDSFSQITITKI